MATLGDLIHEIEDFLSSHGADRDACTTLTTVGGITATATSFTVSDARSVTTGLVQIDDELIWVESKSGSTITVPAWGRGQRGTTAVAHAENAKVTVNPRFPRNRIKAEINTAITNLFPQLFAVTTDTSNTATGHTIGFPLPAAAEWVLRVFADTVGPSKAWLPLRRWRFNFSANTTEFPTGKSLDVLDPVPPGQTIQVVFANKFGALNLDGDTLTGAGLKDEWRDLITMAVCSKLVLALDVHRLQTTSVEQANRAQQVQVGSAAAVSRRLMDAYHERLAAERRQLLQQYPASITFAS